MKRLIPLTALVTALLCPTLTHAADKPAKVLVVTVTEGFRHSSIPTAEKILAKIGTDSGAFTLDYVQQGASKEESRENLKKLSPESLKNYDAVIFANTTGDLPLPDNQGFIDWVAAGGAFIGMHSASDTFHGFRPYVEMLGGEFLTHGAQATVDALNQDPKHPACAHLKESWTIHDEIYILKSFDKSKVHGLLTLDKHPNSKEPGHHPVAWCKEIGKGKLFYTSLGHREDVWENPVYQEHILGGIKWALGQAPGSAKPDAK